MFTNSVFRKDPFFQHDQNFPTEMDRSDRMMQEFWHPYHMPTTSPMMPSIAPPLDNDDGRMVRYRRRLSTMPLGRPYSHADMFRNMETMFNEAKSHSSPIPNAQSYSSSRVYSYSSDGVHEPKRYEACSETTQGPGGVRQTLNRERNSVTGKDRMQAGRYIYDRGHAVEKTQDMNTGKDYNLNHDYYNIDSSQSNQFHREWNEKAPAMTRYVLTRNDGLADRKLLKWQHGFSRNFDGTDFEGGRRITYD